LALNILDFLSLEATEGGRYRRFSEFCRPNRRH